MDYNFVENRTIFTKTAVHRFEKLVYLKIFGQNGSKKFKVLHRRQFMEVKNCVKITGKRILLGFLKTGLWFPFPQNSKLPSCPFPPDLLLGRSDA
jgi:hypothetical protein